MASDYLPSPSTVGEAIRELAACADLFVEAQQEGIVYFEGDIQAGALAVIGATLLKNASLSPEARQRSLKHLTRFAQSQARRQITQVSESQNRQLREADILGLLEKDGPKPPPR